MKFEERTEKRICRVGDRASMTKVFTREDVEKFADLTMDYNGMHMDAGLSRRGLFRRPVVHGILVGSLISSVMGMELPGHGTVLQSQDIQYLQPVYPGDTITAEVVLTEIEEHDKFYIATLAGTCHNQDGVLVVKAVSKELMLKRLFEVQK